MLGTWSPRRGWQLDQEGSDLIAGEAAGGLAALRAAGRRWKLGRGWWEEATGGVKCVLSPAPFLLGLLPAPPRAPARCPASPQGQEQQPSDCGLKPLKKKSFFSRFSFFSQLFCHSDGKLTRRLSQSTPLKLHSCPSVSTGDPLQTPKSKDAQLHYFKKPPKLKQRRLAHWKSFFSLLTILHAV